MKQLLVISGKGGTGKTSLTACLARLAENAVFVDADVDAANLHLLLEADIREHESFYSGYLAEWDAEKCNDCGACLGLCRFQALEQVNGRITIDPLGCEGCGVCVDHCPRQAIRLEPRLCGHQFLSHTPSGPLVHACLGPGGENSGKLVTAVRKVAQELAEEQRRELIIIDGPPGIGCPVIAASGGCDMAILVTEPTLSGRHDMERAAELMRHFNIPAAVIINKADLNPNQAESIRRYAESHDMTVLAELPYHPAFTQAQREGKTVLQYQPDGNLAGQIKTLWREIQTLLRIGERI